MNEMGFRQSKGTITVSVYVQVFINFVRATFMTKRQAMSDPDHAEIKSFCREPYISTHSSIPRTGGGDSSVVRAPDS